MRNHLAAFALALLSGCTPPSPAKKPPSSVVLHDSARHRAIPVTLYFPDRSPQCLTTSPCPTALLSPGHGVSHDSYSFIAEALNNLGYLVVAIQHQLPSDPDMPRSGDIARLRTPFWKQGAENAHFVRKELIQRHPQFDWQHIVLIGHSNGGDIFAWLLGDHPTWASSLITLDNRRVPLPRGGSSRILSIRAGDFPADPGVLPAPDEDNANAICIVTLAYARHNDMHDKGSLRLRHAITSLIESFLRTATCPSAAASLES